jgi:hypothetical protein
MRAFVSQEQKKTLDFRHHFSKRGIILLKEADGEKCLLQEWDDMANVIGSINTLRYGHLFISRSKGYSTESEQEDSRKSAL